MVKLIHTADLHLDSAFRSRFTKEEAAVLCCRKKGTGNLDCR